jgi:hypothetical protein
MAFMRITTLVLFTALSFLTSPALACKVLVKYPQHLWGSTVGWWEAYRVVEIVEARGEAFIVMLKQNFRDKADVGKLTALQFIANEEAHAICAISLEVGKTYLVRSRSSTEPLLISRFNWMNIPSTHSMYGIYSQDLESAALRQ